uniref:Uncharacterized protein n=1 Tax=Strongyloides venezuelensis TaxID=75913 RepID=A0A0K0F141_STRVS
MKIAIKILSLSLYPNKKTECLALNAIEVKFWTDKITSGARLCLKSEKIIFKSQNNHTIFYYKSSNAYNNVSLLYKAKDATTLIKPCRKKNKNKKKKTFASKLHYNFVNAVKKAYSRLLNELECQQRKETKNIVNRYMKKDDIIKSVEKTRIPLLKESAEYHKNTQFCQIFLNHCIGISRGIKFNCVIAQRRRILTIDFKKCC